MNRVLITGASGFLGSNLIKRIGPKIEILTLNSNLLNFDQLNSEIKAFGNTITACFHFAGISAVPDCENDLTRAYMINTSGALALAELLAKYSPGSHFIFPSTGQLYAPDIINNLPLTESAPLALTNVYTRVKRLAELGLENLSQQKKIYVTVLRLFNHSHKSQDARFFLPSIYQQIIQAKTSSEKKITLGDLNLIRDIGAVNDLVTVLEKILHSTPTDKFQIYNVCSGVGKKLQDIVDEMVHRLDSKFLIAFDPKLVRPGEPKIICGNPQKLMSAFDWQPINALSVADLVNSFLQEII